MVLLFGRFAALFVLLGMSVAPAPARAGDCGGSEHYTYDHGDCTDKTGDLFDVMDKAYDQSYRQDLGMTQRSRNALPAVGGRPGRPGFDTGQMSRDLVTVLSFTPVSPSPAVVALSGLMKPSLRAAGKKALNEDLAAYANYAATHGLSRDFYPSAFVLFTEVVYFISSGEHFERRAEQNAFQFGASEALAKTAIARLSDRKKQALNDALVIFAAEVLGDYRVARLHRDQKGLAAARHDADGLMRLFLHTDPRTTRLTDWECLGRNRPVCSLVQWTSSGGKRGVDPIRQMVDGWQQGNRMLGIH
jgi:hypothetical protein